VQVIVVDEIHAFAGDDRGWHLLAVLERIRHITGHDTQRIGLSATVGNPEKLLKWLTGTSERESTIVSPPASSVGDADVTIDFVGNLPNAARVLSLLHRGEKRLVFCDSRSRAEELATHLRSQGVATFISHSSLSAEQRRDAEAAFRDARDCVIVATSTLELGIDVGDLDRVIQLDAPGTVASFLQRLGRTGRREGSVRNCLFLTTSPAALLQASALVLLWREGFVEALTPPAKPYHVAAQQLMTIVLQQGGIGRTAWREWLLGLLSPMDITERDVEALLVQMLSRQILVQDGARLLMGPEGERLYGGKNFMDLLSVFDTPPMFTVFCGPRDLGQVHPLSFQRSDGAPAILSLGGRPWLVVHVDFAHQTAEVVPTEGFGRSRWLGDGRPLSYEMCQAIRRVLLGSEPGCWSKRATEEVGRVQAESNFVARDGLVVLIDQEEGRTTWWTFAGLLANVEVAAQFKQVDAHADNLTVTMKRALRAMDFQHQFQEQGQQVPTFEQSGDLKFQDCLPDGLLDDMRRSRLRDVEAVDATKTAGRIYRGRLESTPPD
jgi:ATP-dependent Lhr-like helicase